MIRGMGSASVQVFSSATCLYVHYSDGPLYNRSQIFKTYSTFAIRSLSVLIINEQTEVKKKTAKYFLMT